MNTSSVTSPSETPSQAISPPRNLLIVRLTALGDIVLALQVVQSAASQWPDCRITWVVRDTFAPLVRAMPFVHEVIVYRRKEGWRGFLNTCREIRRQRFDLVWDMHGLIRPAFMTLFARAGAKWGKKHKKGLRTLPYSRAILLPSTPLPHHSLDLQRQFLCAAGLDSSIQFPLQLRPTPPEGKFRPEWEAFLTDDSGPLFIMFTDSSSESKNWNGFAALSHQVWKHIPNSRIVWSGLKLVPPPTEAPVGRFLDLQKVCSMPQMIPLLRLRSIFIGNDSGPMHLSAAFGNPVLGLFGPSSPHRFGPWPLGAANTQVAVSPTNKLADLAPDVVFGALQTLLQRVNPALLKQ